MELKLSVLLLISFIIRIMISGELIMINYANGVRCLTTTTTNKPTVYLPGAK
jgi:hypothetical protein